MNPTLNLDISQFDSAAAEHITLATDDTTDGTDGTDDAPPARQQTQCKFVQVTPLRDTKRTVEIFDGHFAAVSDTTGSSPARRYEFDLGLLDPSPRRYACIAWRWFQASIVFGMAAAVAVWLLIAAQTPLLQHPWLPLGVLFIAASVLAFIVFLQRTRFTLVFRSRHGKTPLLELAAHNPSRRAVRDFAETARLAIQAGARQYEDDPKRLLRDELRTHCRLWESGSLPDPLYEAGKKRILAAHE